MAIINLRNSNVSTSSQDEVTILNQQIVDLSAVIEILALNELADVTIATPADGQLLAYNGGTSEWENNGNLLVTSSSVDINVPVTVGGDLNVDGLVNITATELMGIPPLGGYTFSSDVDLNCVSQGIQLAGGRSIHQTSTTRTFDDTTHASDGFFKHLMGDTAIATYSDVTRNIGALTWERSESGPNANNHAHAVAIALYDADNASNAPSNMIYARYGSSVTLSPTGSDELVVGDDSITANSTITAYGGINTNGIGPASGTMYIQDDADNNIFEFGANNIAAIGFTGTYNFATDGTNSLTNAIQFQTGNDKHMVFDASGNSTFYGQTDESSTQDGVSFWAHNSLALTLDRDMTHTMKPVQYVSVASGSTAPSSPGVGEFWFDTTTSGGEQLKTYRGGSWINVYNQPNGLTFYDLTAHRLVTRVNGSWVKVSTEAL